VLDEDRFNALNIISNGSRGRTIFRAISNCTWIGLSVVFLASASIFAKQAGLTSAGHGLLSIVLNVWYAGEMAALLLQACCWIMVLRRFSLAFAYPFTSAVFALNLISSRLIFRESVSANNVVGIVLIGMGVALSSRSIHR
jgi:drug/metabolite transporter (DMT)-like permease